MTKADVAIKVAAKTGLSRKDASEAVEMFLNAVKEALKKGEKVSLVGFGTFNVKTKLARSGRNPRTGEKISIPRKQVATFKPGKSFRELVNRAPAV
jgi:DNA-binding protein HU-beta